jgi:hypothetical protein
MSKLSTALQKAEIQDEFCSYVAMRSKLNDEDMLALDNALNKGVPSYILAKILRSEGRKISHSTIQDHRDNTCKCVREAKK